MSTTKALGTKAAKGKVDGIKTTGTNMAGMNGIPTKAALTKALGNASVNKFYPTLV